MMPVSATMVYQWNKRQGSTFKRGETAIGNIGNNVLFSWIPISLRLSDHPESLTTGKGLIISINWEPWTCRRNFYWISKQTPYVIFLTTRLRSNAGRPGTGRPPPFMCSRKFTTSVLSATTIDGFTIALITTVSLKPKLLKKGDKNRNVHLNGNTTG